MFTLIFSGLALIAVLIHLTLMKKPRTAGTVLEILLLYLFFFNMGFGGLLAFYGHTARAAETALSIGWQPGSPFQFEVAVANLAFGVLGILCLWMRGNFWWAAAVGGGVFGLGAAYGHIRDMILAQNFAPNNAGLILWYGDIFLPLLLLLLLATYSRMKD
ncbi:MAG: hypothetical protein PHH60_04725 [Candidatus Margulisbacteria bacterium]|nr:hypothetical protein [Candidatus Margulisiibacteriota bacterium]